MIHVIATVELEPGRRADFLQEFRKVMPLVREEHGCQQYVPTIDVETSIAAQVDYRSETVTIVEIWDDLDALEAHLIAPHMLEYRTRVKLMVKSTRLQILGSVEKEPDTSEEQSGA